MLLKYLLISLLSFTSAFIYTKVIFTPLYKNNHLVKFHNIVLFQKNKIIKNNNYENIFVIDFVPDEDITNIKTIIKLLFGKNINGKIRIFYYNKITKKEIIYELYETNQKLCNKNVMKSYDKNIYNIINEWNSTFNLYTHNCKHFSNYFTKLCNKI